MSAVVTEWRINPRWVPALLVLNGTFTLIFLWAAMALLQESSWLRAFSCTATAALALHMSGSLIRTLRADPPEASRPLADRMAYVLCYAVVMLGGLAAILAR